MLNLPNRNTVKPAKPPTQRLDDDFEET